MQRTARFGALHIPQKMSVASELEFRRFSGVENLGGNKTSARKRQGKGDGNLTDQEGVADARRATDF